jgi:hypothetical protein
MATDREKITVRQRAKHRCEYCHAPEHVTGYAFHIEHIRPRKRGGRDDVSNFALCCMPCNRAKWHHATGVDPQTGKEQRLFNPRKDNWARHFQIEKRLYIRGKTPVGRATESCLEMNQRRQLEARQLWIELGIYP